MGGGVAVIILLTALVTPLVSFSAYVLGVRKWQFRRLAPYSHRVCGHSVAGIRADS